MVIYLMGKGWTTLSSALQNIFYQHLELVDRKLTCRSAGSPTGSDWHRITVYKFSGVDSLIKITASLLLAEPFKRNKHSVEVDFTVKYALSSI